ncbi:6-phosphogluconate dehydrogenase C-terminal domain-like protein [Kalaharituber pfeilii]|nr:6-phosphogluconate dehydrogenase C-terminal domain-like protein [Kalaharituber pfeilii]
MSGQAFRKASGPQRSVIGIIGTGAIGSNIALLLASPPASLHISLWDKDVSTVLDIIKDVPEDLSGQVHGPFTDLYEFISSLADANSPTGGALILLSLPHGSVVDAVLSDMNRHLKKRDVILDTGNEWYLDTERRQKELARLGVTLCSLEVSGGYQSARRGPSLHLSGDNPEVKKEVLKLLELVAAKDENGKPCVKDLGPGGVGHYVKMVHNGIEQGMLGVINEVWEIMFKCLSMTLDEIGDVFGKWTRDGGEMKNNYLLTIGSEICHTKRSTAAVNTSDPPEDDGMSPFLLNTIQDKVVQDADSSEGTGIWTVSESAHKHVSAPTISCAHFYRIASADRAQRLAFADLIGGEVATAKKQKVTQADKSEFIETTIRRGMYAGFLASFAQGINLLLRASHVHGWNLSILKCIEVWRAGTIIRDDTILDLLSSIYTPNESSAHPQNVLLNPSYGAQVKAHIPQLKRLVLKGIEWDAHVPALSASLEYYKFCGGKHLPTQFMEAQLDYFGKHNFELKSEGLREVKKGVHHYEWKPA